MGLVSKIFFFPLTQEHQLLPLPFKLSAAGYLPKHNPLSISAASRDETFIDTRIQFLKFLPRCRDVELFAKSRLLNNTYSDVGTTTDVFNQLGSFVRCHDEYLIGTADSVEAFEHHSHFTSPKPRRRTGLVTAAKSSRVLPGFCSCVEPG